MKILVAEDDAIQRKILSTALAKGGHEVFLAEDGLQAWEMLQQTGARVVITDWLMPGMTGIELCNKIRDAKFPSYTYIIMQTTKEGTENALEALGAGADDFIIKPVNLMELNARLRAALRIIQLEELQQQTRLHLFHSEKMASVGQLAAGVAHEINNPTGFVSSNIKTLQDYVKDVSELIAKYQRLKKALDKTALPEPLSARLQDIRDYEKEIDLAFIMEDTQSLIADCRDGVDRIKKIVSDLKDFAHPGSDEIKPADINQGLESTLNVVWNEIKYKAKVTKDLGALPQVWCYPQRLNQVFMNILVNAAQAIENQGEIRIVTRPVGDHIVIEISDTGKGISEENISKIFDPFFTTKDVGKGTGLGLNMAYNIIQTHGGSIRVKSKAGEGTTFRIDLPVDGMKKNDPA